MCGVRAAPVSLAAAAAAFPPGPGLVDLKELEKRVLHIFAALEKKGSRAADHLAMHPPASGKSAKAYGQAGLYRLRNPRIHVFDQRTRFLTKY